MSRRNRTGTSVLRSSVSLGGDGKAPTSITLLKPGVNRTDHYGEGDGGEFTFDGIAAAMVMQAFQGDDHGRIFADWNHGSIPRPGFPPPTREQGASSCSFIPVIGDDGSLIASDIEWTDEGRADVEGGTYNLFSPAFEWAFCDDGVCRPSRLVNFALVNLAGLKGIKPLMAAMSAVNNERTTEMDYEKLYNETKGQLETANARIRTLEGAGSHVVALSMAVGVEPTAPEADRVSAVKGLVALRSSLLKSTGAETPETAIGAVSGLVTLRSEVFEITGQKTPEQAVAAVRALKAHSDELIPLKEKIKQDEIVALRTELDNVWAGAIKELKLPPGKKDAAEASILAMAGGQVTRAAVDGAKTFVSMLSAQVVGGDGTPQRETNASLLTEEDKAVARMMGNTPEQVAAFKKQRLGIA